MLSYLEERVSICSVDDSTKSITFSLFKNDGITTKFFSTAFKEACYSYNKHHLFPVQQKDNRMRNLNELQRN
jgi:hypothetical protein